MSTETHSHQLQNKQRTGEDKLAAQQLQKLFNNVIKTGVTKYEPQKQNITEFLSQVLNNQIKINKNSSMQRKQIKKIGNFETRRNESVKPGVKASNKQILQESTSGVSNNATMENVKSNIA